MTTTGMMTTTDLPDRRPGGDSGLPLYAKMAGSFFSTLTSASFLRST